MTATGLELVVLGEVKFGVDGAPVDFAQTWTYKGPMYSGVPNFVSTFGYMRPGRCGRTSPPSTRAA